MGCNTGKSKNSFSFSGYCSLLSNHPQDIVSKMERVRWIHNVRQSGHIGQPHKKLNTWRNQRRWSQEMITSATSSLRLLRGDKAIAQMEQLVAEARAKVWLWLFAILGDPGEDSGGVGKSKRAGKYSTKKSKEQREEPLGTIGTLRLATTDYRWLDGRLLGLGRDKGFSPEPPSWL